jgi:glycosyltransferase involved in cell wall biosynthesis
VTRILYVTSVSPVGPTYGARIRVANIGRLLGRLGPVTFVLASSEGIDPGTRAEMAADFDSVHVARVRPDPLAGARDRIRFETDPSFMNTHFSSVSEPDRSGLGELFESHDVAWVHTIATANALRIFRRPRTVLDIDDLPSRSYRSRLHSGPGLVRRVLNYRMSLVWRRRERELKNRFDVLTVCSEDDRRYLGSGPGIRVVPNGFDPPSPPPARKPVTPPRLGFIGTFDYPPNREGVAWFIDKVWPRIKQARPDATLRLAGLKSDLGPASSDPAIRRLGYIDDPGDEIATWAAMIVPILTAAGTRIKIAEAFGRMCPIVSTSLGAFGYEVRSGQDLFIADRPEEFAGACLRLIVDPETGRRLAESARAKFESRWSWKAIAPAVAEAVSLAADCGAGGDPAGRGE